jgi:hypothetical protein
MRKTQTENVFLIWFSQDMLLSNDHFVAVLVDSLLLDDDHPRKAAGSFESVKAAVQRDAAEALQQLTVYPPGRAALLGDPTVAVGKRHFLRCHLHIKFIILPRQARDKHRENSKPEWRFLRRRCLRLPTAAGRTVSGEAVFLSHLYRKTNILPRQARDNYRENTQKGGNHPPSSLALFLLGFHCGKNAIDCQDRLGTKRGIS